MSTETVTLPVDPTAPPKIRGDNLEAELIARHDPLESIPDADAEWMDARTTGLLEPSPQLAFGGICVVESKTPVEVKTAKLATSNGSYSDTPGRWFIKQDAHERLVESGGVYLLAVYADTDTDSDECELLAVLVVPARTVDDALDSRWYDSGRREGLVAKLAWTHLIPRSRITGGDG